MEGKILKGIGGFYYVKTDNDIVTCRARGLFRKEKITPLVGDMVKITDAGDDEGYVTEIMPRKNSLVRPPISNVDKLFIVVSTISPKPNMLLIDKSIALAEVKDIEPILVVTKLDLENNDDILEMYKSIGIKTFEIFGDNGVDRADILAELEGNISAFTGNSGVGKSTLLNSIMPNLELQTGETSKKLGRGKHTTRHVELYEVNGGYVADTPGFATMDFVKFEMMEASEIQYGFREFDDYRDKCKFNSCTHTVEKGCAVLEAVKNSEILRSRIDSYIAMYNEVKDVKKWQTTKNV